MKVHLCLYEIRASEINGLRISHGPNEYCSWHDTVLYSALEPRAQIQCYIKKKCGLEKAERYLMDSPTQNGETQRGQDIEVPGRSIPPKCVCRKKRKIEKRKAATD
jgi:hypothetical protein